MSAAHVTAIRRRRPGDAAVDVILDSGETVRVHDRRVVEHRSLQEMPSPYAMSNSACLNGGATLFLTTFTRTRFPTASVPSLSVSIRRMSSRTDE